MEYIYSFLNFICTGFLAFIEYYFSYEMNKSIQGVKDIINSPQFNVTKESIQLVINDLSDLISSNDKRNLYFMFFFAGVLVDQFLTDLKHTKSIKNLESKSLLNV